MISFLVTIDRVQTTETPDGRMDRIAFMTVQAPNGERLGAAMSLRTDDEIAIARPGVRFRVAPVPDTDPPTTPENLRFLAAPGGMPAITWSPSTDDIDVMAYEVQVDDKIIQTDDRLGAELGGLAYGDHNATITAIDTAGNRSEPATLDFTHEEPPPPAQPEPGTDPTVGG